jgi:hypothetical protein
LIDFIFYIRILKICEPREGTFHDTSDGKIFECENKPCKPGGIEGMPDPDRL